MIFLKDQSGMNVKEFMKRYKKMCKKEETTRDIVKRIEFLNKFRMMFCEDQIKEY